MTCPAIRSVPLRYVHTRKRIGYAGIEFSKRARVLNGLHRIRINHVSCSRRYASGPIIIRMNERDFAISDGRISIEPSSLRNGGTTIKFFRLLYQMIQQCVAAIDRCFD
jgi:hypothetical protein